MAISRGTLSVATCVLLAALATTGAVLSPPSFDPPPLTTAQEFGTLPAQPPAETAPVSTNAPISVEDLTVQAKGTTLQATIRAPITSGRHPAMVFVQGSGRGDRGEFTEQAEWLARAGIVTLVYDKRTVGYTFRSRDFGLLADDALRMIATLRRRHDVDLSRTGLWGVSEGGWVVPIAAARSADVGFVVLVSSPNVTPLRQVAWALNEQLLRLHAPYGVRDLLTRAMGGVGFNFLRYDSTPAIRQIKRPVLALYGTADPSIPFVESTRKLTSALEEGGNRDYTIRFLNGADHAMRINGGPLVKEYLPTLSRWILGLPKTARPEVPIAGATPVQRFEASDVPQAPWYGDMQFLTLAMMLAAVGFIAAPVTEMVVRLRGGEPAEETNARVWPQMRRRLYRMAWTALGLIAAVLAFITLIVLFSVNQAGAWPAVLAGWLVIRVLAILILVQEVTAGAAVVAGLREGWQPSRWQKLALSGVLGGAGLLLIAASYYGLFSLPW
ncbi:prolyl oligopeptidase family serine peptidase [Thermopolyspora sp. NPDC052614]|uniref:alpha/beta hydrolase family protein n=1 Tax=Thermopolyspora sp. NPDC052614 TaxID=3155682 RepID=UPI00342E92FE